MEQGETGSLSLKSQNFYLDRFGFIPSQIDEAPAENLGITVTLPSYREENLKDSLLSLYACTEPPCAVELIIVLNCALENEESTNLNELSYKECANLEHPKWITTYFLKCYDLPKKHAGVGLARKIAMDEAVHRFDLCQNNHPEIITCFDADAFCEPNYLQELYKHFKDNPKTPGCSIHYEHRSHTDPVLNLGIEKYELHLRYYVNALRFAGHPHAYQTIGSSMACTASEYQAEGGMNRRKAGEDFYFLHKLIVKGGFTRLNTTTVLPSPRISTRVPFGTGRAQNQYAENRSCMSYDLKIFEVIKELIQRVPKLYQASSTELTGIEPVLLQFLSANNIDQALEEIRRQSTNENTFRDRFFRWFNGFMALKCVHYLRDHLFPLVEIEIAAVQLLQKEFDNNADTSTTSQLLALYRNWDKSLEA